VSGADGTPIANGVAFATTTTYNDVAPGLWTLRVTPTGSSAQTVLTCRLQAGAGYSLLVLDGPDGVRAQLRIDAAGPGQPPTGAIEAGAGGTDGNRTAGLNPLVFVGGGLVVLVALLGIALRTRRLASRRS